MCTGIRSIHYWIRGYSNSFYAFYHAWVTAALKVRAPFAIVTLFK